jgi:hypothetical protein
MPVSIDECLRIIRVVRCDEHEHAVGNTDILYGRKTKWISKADHGVFLADIANNTVCLWLIVTIRV